MVTGVHNSRIRRPPIGTVTKMISVHRLHKRKHPWCPFRFCQIVWATPNQAESRLRQAACADVSVIFHKTLPPLAGATVAFHSYKPPCHNAVR